MGTPETISIGNDVSTPAPAPAASAPVAPASTSVAPNPTPAGSAGGAIPDTLPANFFSNQGSTPAPSSTSLPSSATPTSTAGEVPDTLPANFFSQQGGNGQNPSQQPLTVGTMVSVNGHHGFIQGVHKDTGKIVVDWGPSLSKGTLDNTSEVSPEDIDTDPGMLRSFVAGAGIPDLNILHSATKLVGALPQSVQSALGISPGDAQSATSTVEQGQQVNQTAASANPYTAKAGSLASDLVQWLAVNPVVKEGTAVGTAIAEEAAEHYATAAKIAKTLKNYPALVRMLRAGINGSLTGGTISGVQSGFDPKTTAEGAAGGAGGEIAGEFLPDAGKAVWKSAKAVGSGTAKIFKSGVEGLQELAEKIPGGIYPKVGEVPTLDEQDAAIDAIKKGPTPEEARQAVQPHYDHYSSDIRSQTGNIMQDDGLTMEPSNSIRDVPFNAAKAYDAEADRAYAQVDDAIEEATGRPGNYKQTDKNINTLQRKIRDDFADPEKLTKWNTQMAIEQAQQAKNLEIIKNSDLDGVPERATAMFKRARAMEDVGQKINESTTDIGGTMERVNPKQASRAFNNLKRDTTYGPEGRLAQAYGKYGDNVIEATNEAQSRLQTAADADKAATSQRLKFAKQAKNQYTNVTAEAKAAQAQRDRMNHWILPGGGLTTAGALLYEELKKNENSPNTK